MTGLVLFAPSLPAQASDSRDETIKVESNLVWVPVSVKGAKGLEIAGLAKEQFRIFDEGVQQEIAHFEVPGAPITVAFVIDMSDSAKVSLREMQTVTANFLDQLKAADNAMIIAFDRQVHKVIGATGDRDMLRLGLNGISTGGGTALYDVVDHVIRSSFEGVSGRKAVILLTDGIDTSSKRATFETSAKWVAERNIPIFPIQFPPEDTLGKRLSSENSHMGSPIYTTPSGETIGSAYQRGTRYLRLLAQSSGGRFQFADSVKNLGSAFSEIAAQLRQQYYLGFYPDPLKDNRSKRKLKVIVSVPGSRVESRESYTPRP